MKELIEEMPDTGYGYGCAVANRFGKLLDDESDPFDLLHQAQVQQERKKKKEEIKKPPAPPAKTGKKESQRERKVPLRTAGDSGVNINRGVAGPRRPARGPPEERVERRVAFNEPRFNEGDDSLGYSIERPIELFDRAGRGRGGGRGRGARGAGYSRSSDGFDPRGKREFERHSGSDRASVRPEEKRGGSGPRNWGSMRDHVSAVADALPNEEIVESEEAPDTAENDGENQPLENEEVIEVAIEMSLDEWKTMQEQSRPKTEFNIRKADTKLPSKAVVIHKSKHIEEHADGISEDDVVFRRPANDITFQLEINFGSLARPSRGGRGGRGGRGRGAAAPQRSPEKYAEAAPNPDDPEDFPALA
ncbi:intracellular hyaluronan-binding protein 4 isoform X2 [Colossoma macropomum]|uniref:intracellular hyaluronan-binding protein 4 isoform X2 n=1 Tax=Colossoma macropomum TaxID=42526 RepID=UPI00186469FE|nr:intracellular hyaluronan-binding protein 4 isoform X2 [Colossoma macropomum]